MGNRRAILLSGLAANPPCRDGSTALGQREGSKPRPSGGRGRAPLPDRAGPCHRVTLLFSWPEALRRTALEARTSGTRFPVPSARKACDRAAPFCGVKDRGGVGRKSSLAEPPECLADFGWCPRTIARFAVTRCHRAAWSRRCRSGCRMPARSGSPELKELEFAPERPAAELPEAKFPPAEPLG